MDWERCAVITNEAVAGDGLEWHTVPEETREDRHPAALRAGAVAEQMKPGRRHCLLAGFACARQHHH